jgi:hypothetical protein
MTVNDNHACILFQNDHSLTPSAADWQQAVFKTVESRRRWECKAVVNLSQKEHAVMLIRLNEQVNHLHCCMKK